jgi:hypothetical protein
MAESLDILRAVVRMQAHGPKNGTLGTLVNRGIDLPGRDQAFRVKKALASLHRGLVGQ